MNLDRWRILMRSLGVGDSLNTYEAITNAYSEKHRYYHTESHIDDCLGKFDMSRGLAIEEHEVELAIWFHDAVYEPLSSDNELKSADWAQSFLIDSGAKQGLADRVHKLIMATLHAVEAADGNARLLVDIDLSILGEVETIYDQFEKSVRKEYALVPEFLFRKKRVEILNSFLARNRIYSNNFFYQRYEERARKNIKGAISKLSYRR